MKKILIVDDNEDVLELAKALLESDGYDITTFLDPEDALNDIFKNTDYDLIITDYQMPKVSGLDLTMAVRKLKFSMPIIMQSGMANMIIKEAKDAGVTVLLEKNGMGGLRDEVSRALAQY